MLWTTIIMIWSVLHVVLGSFSINNLVDQSVKSRPRNGRRRGSLKVHIGLYLESIGNFRSTEMSFDVDLYLYMSWRDARLAHNRTKHLLINDNKFRDLIWLPDLYFANARHARFQDVTVPNFNIFISNDGTLSYSCRATCSISCSLNLVNYPMDKQHCYIRILSYAHIADEVDVHWFTRNPITYNPEIGLPEFAIEQMTESYCDGQYRYALTEGSYKTGNFSCLMANIFLSRSIGYNLVQSYIPTGLTVIISWVNFWIDRRAVPARVTLSFSTLVSLTTLGSGLRIGLPQVSYAKAIDFWFGACMFFVICVLLEFALINSYMRRSEKYEHLSKNEPRASIISKRGSQKRGEYTNEASFTDTAGDGKLNVSDLSDENGSGKRVKTANTSKFAATRALPTRSHFYNKIAREHSRRALQIDKMCRYIFPASFFLFNTVYWSYYLIF